MAPHLVSVYENTSVLHDEFLAQRIGLIPFYSETVDNFKYPWKCDCSAENIYDCQTCKLQFRLQFHHKYISDNKDEPFRDVTSLDI
jgi:DNA-directed RNA polymerase II subunit RPB3